MSGISEFIDLFAATVQSGDDLNADWVSAAMRSLERRAMSMPLPHKNGFWEPGFGWPPGRFGLWPPDELGPIRWPPDEPAPDSDSPIGFPEFPDLEGFFQEFEHCIRLMAANIAQGRARKVPWINGEGDSEPEYVIDSVTPNYPCPGEELTITGTGFTGTGSVRFLGGARVPPEFVSDTQIKVLVPEAARSGPVWLHIPQTIRICGTDFLIATKHGISGEFLAGQARLVSFEVEGGSTCLPPNQDFTLHWVVEPEVNVEIYLYEILGDSRDLLYQGFDISSFDVAGNENGPRQFQIFARHARGACENPEQRLTVELDDPAVLTWFSANVTQGIDRYPIWTNPVPLIAGKDTVVRAFVSSDRGGIDGDISQITGFMRLGNPDIGENVTTRYAPINVDAMGAPQPIIDAKPWPDRKLTNDGLNFLILAADANGDCEIEIEIFNTGGCTGFASITARFTISWIDVPALPVTVRRIADPWTGDALTETEAIDVVTEAFERLPSPPTRITPYPGTFDIQNISAEANYCHDGGFNQLGLSVAYEHNDVEGYWPDPHESIWIGLYFQTNCTIPGGGSIGGMMAWPWTSTCISNRFPETAAHEIAHCVGMGHTVTSLGEPCNNITQPIPCHVLPNNGLLPGDFFDIRNNRTRTNVHDLMSYQGGYLFPHPNHWEMMIDLIRNRF